MQICNSDTNSSVIETVFSLWKPGVSHWKGYEQSYCAALQNQVVQNKLKVTQQIKVNRNLKLATDKTLSVQFESYQKRALQIIYGDQIKGMPYFNILSLANLESL